MCSRSLRNINTRTLREPRLSASLPAFRFPPCGAGARRRVVVLRGGDEVARSGNTFPANPLFLWAPVLLDSIRHAAGLSATSCYDTGRTNATTGQATASPPRSTITRRRAQLKQVEVRQRPVRLVLEALTDERKDRLRVLVAAQRVNAGASDTAHYEVRRERLKTRITHNTRRNWRVTCLLRVTRTSSVIFEQERWNFPLSTCTSCGANYLRKV